MEFSEAPGILTLNSTSNSTVLQLHNQCPKQVLRLKRVSVELSTPFNLTTNMLYVDLAFLSVQQLLDGIQGRFLLPITLDHYGSSAVETPGVTSYSTDLPIYMAHHVHNQVKMEIRDYTGALVTNLVSICLQFEFKYGHTS